MHDMNIGLVESFPTTRTFTQPVGDTIVNALITEGVSTALYKTIAEVLLANGAKSKLLEVAVS
jgi:hypothetical protein